MKAYARGVGHETAAIGEAIIKRAYDHIKLVYSSLLSYFPFFHGSEWGGGGEERKCVVLLNFINY